MILFPAIDLVAGQVVRLRRGDRSQMDVYSTDPVAVARDFAARGARWVHVVDLSSAFREDAEAVEKNHRAIAAGAKRIAIGTALVRDPEFAAEAARLFPEHVVADVAACDGEVRVDGWRDGEGIAADTLVAHLADLGYRHLVFTDISRDGMQTGVDVDAYRHIAKVAGFPVVASGGIATLDDIRALATLGPDVIEGAITGRALYEGSFTLEDALAAAGRRA